MLNDVFDANLDKTERPERPIPSGIISRKSAAIFGVLLLVFGIVSAGLSDTTRIFSTPVLIATGIAIASVIYNKWSKHSGFFGPLNMGLCRALNLLLGMTLVEFSLTSYWCIL